MTKQAEQTTAQPITLPAGTALEDLVAAVSRGVSEAFAAQDDVGGYALGLSPMPLVLTTVTVVSCPAPPPQDPRYSGSVFDQVAERK